jgi:hypothetical protein
MLLNKGIMIGDDVTIKHLLQTRPLINGDKSVCMRYRILVDGERNCWNTYSPSQLSPLIRSIVLPDRISSF